MLDNKPPQHYVARAFGGDSTTLELPAIGDVTQAVEEKAMKDLEPNLKSLDDRLKKARSQVDEGKVEVVPSPIGIAWRLGIELVAGVVVGLFIGIALDDWLGTKPVFLILLVFLGFGAGIRNVVRESKRMQVLLEAEENARDK